MLTLIPDLPANVVGVEATSEVTSDDYETVLIPAVEAARASAPDGKVRILYVLGRDFPDYSAGAMWADTRLGLSHPRSWERIAIVSDSDWLRHTLNALGWMIPGEVRLFPSDEPEAARSWVTSSD